MAFSATQSPTERGPPNLLSNNPFRNRTGPPSSAHPTTYRPTTNGRSLSSNPFLDSTDIALTSPDRTMGEKPEELLEALTIAEEPNRRPPPPPPVHSKVTSPGPENVRPHERDLANWNVFADSCDTSPKRLHNISPKRLQRRKSDTSVGESSRRPGVSDHGRRRRQSRKEKPNRKLDMIDKLDGTSIFGRGLFHHDGPFDACNPNHNQKKSQTAPIHAFPKDSKNMTLGGVDPNNSKIDLEKYNGLSAQGYTDYSASAVGVGGDRPINSRSASFNPLTKEEPLHGEESMGLGTSTFLDGTPASRTAIQRRQSDCEVETNGRLGRKKSLRVKIRGISHKPLSPEFREQPRTATSPPGTSQTLSDRNPSFKDYDEEYEKKGAQISDAGDQAGSARAPNPKPWGLERKTTVERVGEGNKSGAGGFLRRVRSLKGGPRR